RVKCYRAIVDRVPHHSVWSACRSNESQPQPPSQGTANRVHIRSRDQECQDGHQRNNQPAAPPTNARSSQMHVPLGIQKTFEVEEILLWVMASVHRSRLLAMRY